MRVAYVCADPGVPVFGRKGCSVHVQEMIRALTTQGARVELFATRLGGLAPPGLEPVTVRELPRSSHNETRTRERSALKANGALRRALYRFGPFDAIYERYSLWSCAAMAYARETATPGLLEVNAPLVEEQAEHRVLCHRAAALRIAQRNFGAALSIIAVSDAVAGYVGRFAIPMERVHVVPNGVDPARFPHVDRPSRLREDETFTLGFVGTLKSWHGLPMLVEAFGTLHAEDPRVRLIVVGDGPERDRLKESLETRGLAAATVLTGAVAPQLIPEWLAAMDVAVAPYAAQADFYFSPLKVLEYMAAGLPVVASRIGQLTELIAHDRTGLLCTPDDPEALAAQLRRLREAPELRLRLGTAARTVVVRDHTWHAATRRIFATVGLTLPGGSSPQPAASAHVEARGEW